MVFLNSKINKILKGIVSVPLYDTLGPQGLNYILE
jgi:hypothetical protein